MKGRSRGTCLVLAAQDIEGLREAAGERLANELVAQLSNKALLRQESDHSAEWASRQLGKFESIEYFASDSGTLTQSLSGQRVVRDAVMASEFFQIRPSSRKNGVTGYFISPGRGAYRGTVPGDDIQKVVVSEAVEKTHQMVFRPETEQWIRRWQEEDIVRLNLKKRIKQPAQKANLLKQKKQKIEGVSFAESNLQFGRRFTKRICREAATSVFHIV